MSVRSDILIGAKAIVEGERESAYGTPERNFEKIAAMWTAYKEINFEPHDVAAMMTLVKIARVSNSPEKLDHWIDMAGYAACGGEVRPDDGP